MYSSLKIQHEFKNHTEYIEQARSICLQANIEQLKLCIRPFISICRQLAKSCIIAEKYNRGITPLKLAIQKLYGKN